MPCPHGTMCPHIRRGGFQTRPFSSREPTSSVGDRPLPDDPLQLSGVPNLDALPTDGDRVRLLEAVKDRGHGLAQTSCHGRQVLVRVTLHGVGRVVRKPQEQSGDPARPSVVIPRSPGRPMKLGPVGATRNLGWGKTKSCERPTNYPPPSPLAPWCRWPRATGRLRRPRPREP